MCVWTETSWTGILVFVISIIGLIFNIYNLIIFLKTRSNRGSFSYLWAARCFGNIWILANYLFYPAVSLLCHSYWFSRSIANHLGRIMIIPYTMIICMQPFIALNIFFAIFLPMKYYKWSTPQIVTFQIIFSFSIGAVLCAGWTIADCDNLYSFETIQWEYECMWWLDALTDTIVVPISFIFVLIIYGAILFKLYWMKTASESKFIYLLVQGVAQSCVFAVDVCLQEYIAPFNDNIWWNFFTSTLSWELSHTIDGILMFLLNNDLRQPVIRLFYPNSTVQHIHQSSPKPSSRIIIV